jgi:antitoxin (DNA-binding transcriptional repressor) of toxin-antitoxin stability system
MATRQLAIETLSITEATERGVSAIMREASQGHDFVVERRGVAVAAVVGMGRFAEMGELERDLRSAALVLSRFATDSGRRVDLDDAIASFGFNRTELESELDADLAAGRT